MQWTMFRTPCEALAELQTNICHNECSKPWCSYSEVPRHHRDYSTALQLNYGLPVDQVANMLPQARAVPGSCLPVHTAM